VGYKFRMNMRKTLVLSSTPTIDFGTDYVVQYELLLVLVPLVHQRTQHLN
jgi:hypothetical protein